MNSTTRVAVYGTLLAGEANHRLLASARGLGEARTVRGFSLFDLGAFPGMVAEGAGVVECELYEVDEATLVTLDRLEGHPRFYRRTQIHFDDGSLAEAYLLRRRDVQGCPRIPSGSWRAFRNRR
jgi:gamma-glutamylcyclotransferase (GGCT)/AIG2-like uncharacterized protein YtfP